MYGTNRSGFLVLIISVMKREKLVITGEMEKSLLEGKIIGMEILVVIFGIEVKNILRSRTQTRST